MIHFIARKALMPTLLALAIAPLSLAASADTDKAERHQQRHVERLDTLQERLGFDDATRAELEAAHQEIRDAHLELKEQDFDSRDERREAYRELHQQHRAALDEILTEEQREELRSAMREQHEERHAERRETMQERLTALVDSWDLSDEEREALTEIRESLYQDMRELRDQEFDDRDERHAAFRELRDEHHAALSEILSDEQLEELKAAIQPKRGDHHGKRDHHHHGKRDHRGERGAG